MIPPPFLLKISYRWGTRWPWMTIVMKYAWALKNWWHYGTGDDTIIYGIHIFCRTFFNNLFHMGMHIDDLVLENITRIRFRHLMLLLLNCKTKNKVLLRILVFENAKPLHNLWPVVEAIPVQLYNIKLN